MPNNHLNSDEVQECEKLVQRVAAILRGERQDPNLRMTDIRGHVISIMYGGILIYVYATEIGIQGEGSVVKTYQDNLLWGILTAGGAPLMDRFLEPGSDDWLQWIRNVSMAARSWTTVAE